MPIKSIRAAAWCAVPVREDSIVVLIQGRATVAGSVGAAVTAAAALAGRVADRAIFNILKQIHF